MTLPPDLLERPAEEAVRRLALVELAAAQAARERLVEGDRDEALHDFRVALRRLRSLLRAHRGVFAVEFPKRAMKRLAGLAGATNPGRDAEVQMAWLAGIADALRPAERAGFRHLVGDLEGRRDEAYRRVEREIVRDFSRLADDLRERLSRYRIAVDLEHPVTTESFAAATRTALARETARLSEKLAALAAVDAGSAVEVDAGHDARIAAKRLRYAAEPLLPKVAAAKRPVQLLKGLQDLLGDLHDGELLAARVGQALSELEARRAQDLVAATLEEAGAGTPHPPLPRRRERAGLIAVAKRLGARRNELVAKLVEEWVGEAAPRRAELESALAALDRALAS